MAQMEKIKFLSEIEAPALSIDGQEVATKQEVENIVDDVSVVKPGTGEYSIQIDINNAISSHSVALGYDTRAGLHGFVVQSVDSVNHTYTLDDVTGLEVGDSYSIRLQEQRYNFGQITAINGNVVTVDPFYDSNLRDDSVCWFAILEKSTIGTTDIGKGAFAEGRHTKATGSASHAEGYETVTVGPYSHAEGLYTKAGYAAHTEGKNTKALGNCAHAEGDENNASGNGSHAEGYRTAAAGEFAHAEGRNTRAEGIASHAEGLFSYTSGSYSHAEGNDSRAIGEASHAEGYGTEATGAMGHAEGSHTHANDFYTHAEGYNSTASKPAAHAEGTDTTASGISSHAEGAGTTASAEGAHVEGINGTASGRGSHAEGYSNASGAFSHTEGHSSKATADYAHAEGTGTKAYGVGSHAEGGETQAGNSDGTGGRSHAEGTGTKALAYAAHAEGNGTTATKQAAHAEGVSTKADGDASHAEGQGTSATGEGSHAEGINGTASGRGSHIEGYSNASGAFSHSEGYNTLASGDYSHAAGQGTKATGLAQTVIGKYNISNTSSLFIVGSGDSDSNRRNAMTVSTEGQIALPSTGSLKIGDTQMTETQLQGILNGGGGGSLPSTIVVEKIVSEDYGVDITSEVLAIPSSWAADKVDFISQKGVLYKGVTLHCKIGITEIYGSSQATNYIEDTITVDFGNCPNNPSPFVGYEYSLYEHGYNAWYATSVTLYSATLAEPVGWVVNLKDGTAQLDEVKANVVKVSTVEASTVEATTHIKVGSETITADAWASVVEAASNIGGPYYTLAQADVGEIRIPMGTRVASADDLFGPPPTLSVDSNTGYVGFSESYSYGNSGVLTANYICNEAMNESFPYTGYFVEVLMEKSAYNEVYSDYVPTYYGTAVYSGTWNISSDGSYIYSQNSQIHYAKEV